MIALEEVAIKNVLRSVRHAKELGIVGLIARKGAPSSRFLAPSFMDRTSLTATGTSIRKFAS
jgi:hypothetical protein